MFGIFESMIFLFPRWDMLISWRVRRPFVRPAVFLGRNLALRRGMGYPIDSHEFFPEILPARWFSQGIVGCIPIPMYTLWEIPPKKVGYFVGYNRQETPKKHKEYHGHTIRGTPVPCPFIQFLVAGWPKSPFKRGSLEKTLTILKKVKGSCRIAKAISPLISRKPGGLPNFPRC